MSQQTNYTHEQVQELLKSAMATAIAEAKKLNPIEQKDYDKRIEAERRKDMAARQLAKIEAQRDHNRRNGCSHSRYSMSAGKNAGQDAPRGQGEWCTSGQCHDDGTLSIICTRCASVWKVRATMQEMANARDGGLMGAAPPPEDKWLHQCAWCSKFYTTEEMKTHEAKCKAEVEVFV